MRRDAFQAIADPNRRAIIALIAVQAMTPSALAEHFDCTRQAVSKHLRVLSDCQLITHTQVGREVHYHFNPGKLKDVADFIEPYRQMWDTKFNQLERLLSARNEKKR